MPLERKRLTPGALRHYLGAAVGPGCVPCTDESTAEPAASTCEIDLTGRPVPATAPLKPL